MRVVLINAVNRFSSTGRNTLEMHEALRRAGHESYIFCTNEHSPDEGIYKVGGRLDHKMHALGSRVLGKQGYFSHTPTKCLINKLREISPDVVMLGNLHANFINLPMLLGYLAESDTATVVVLHDFWFMTGHCCHYTEDGCKKWQKGCHSCPILHKYNRSLFFDNSRRIFEDKKRLFNSIQRLGVVGVSDWTISDARLSPVFANAKIFRRIYNWIDLETFRPTDAGALRKRLGIGDDRFVVLGVSQKWGSEKGLDVFIDLARRRPDVEVVLVGGYTPMTDIPANLHLVGATSSTSELAEYYSMADVFLTASLQETFGKVSAEALACGTPVICNDRTACPEIPDKQSGYIIHDNNPSEIDSALYWVMKSDRSALAEASRRRALVAFDKNKNIASYIALFQEISKH